MYSYTRNNPLRLVDNNGKWSTAVHNQIIDAAFPGLSDSQRIQLKAISHSVDQPSGQTRAHNYEHAMKSPGEDAAHARAEIDRNIQNHEQAAQNAQGGTPEHADQINKTALDEFGKALHTVTDRTSPAHTDANGNPRDWKGIPNPFSKSQREELAEHKAEESNPTPEQLEMAIVAAQQALKYTFGDAAFQSATTVPNSSDKTDPNAGTSESAGP